MEFDSDVLTRVLAACCGIEPEGPEETALLLRKEQPSLAATCYAAWRNEGSSLNPALRYELDLQLARMARYRALAAEIAAAVPELISVKGLEVAALYPADSVRQMNDLDYVAPDPARAWRVARLLVDQGWELHSGTFWTIGDDLHVLVVLRLPHEDRYALPYGVEVTTYASMGDLGGVDPVVTLPPAWRREPLVKNLMMLLLERFEQPYRARDLVDAALQLAALGDHDALRGELDRLALWPEHAELLELLDRAGLDVPDATPRPGRGVVARSRARRAARVAAGARRPGLAVVRRLQQQLVFGRQSAVGRHVWAQAERRLTAAQALRAGVLCFGLPVTGPQPGVTATTVRDTDGVTWVDTPAGRFLLAIGDGVSQREVDTVVGAPAAPATGSGPAAPDPAAPDPAAPDHAGPDPAASVRAAAVDPARPSDTVPSVR